MIEMDRKFVRICLACTVQIWFFYMTSDCAVSNAKSFELRHFLRLSTAKLGSVVILSTLLYHCVFSSQSFSVQDFDASNDITFLHPASAMRCFAMSCTHPSIWDVMDISFRLVTGDLRHLHASTIEIMCIMCLFYCACVKLGCDMRHGLLSTNPSGWDGAVSKLVLPICMVATRWSVITLSVHRSKTWCR